MIVDEDAVKSLVLVGDGRGFVVETVERRRLERFIVNLRALPIEDPVSASGVG